jgi:hypothetical protein
MSDDSSKNLLDLRRVRHEHLVFFHTGTISVFNEKIFYHEKLRASLIWSNFDQSSMTYPEWMSQLYSEVYNNEFCKKKVYKDCKRNSRRK